MPNVLVTGATGFIGGRLAEVLTRHGDSVRCLVRNPAAAADLDALGVELIHGDLRDEAAVAAAVRGVETVYHLAGLTRAFRKQDLWETNERGTTAIASACARQETPPVHVYVSTIAAGGPARSGKPRVETDVDVPVSNYGRSKLAGERAAAKYADRVPTTIVRPGIVFGPKNRECLPIFSTIDRFGIHPVAGFRSPPLSYLYVDDLIDLLLRAARVGARVADPKSAGGAVRPGYYYATLDEYPNYAEFGRQVAAALERRLTAVLPVVMPLAYLAAGVNECLARLRGTPDPFNIDKMREAFVLSWACSSRRAQEELGFRTSGALADQLRATAEWYRGQGWLPPRPSRPLEPDSRRRGRTRLPYDPCSSQDSRGVSGLQRSPGSHG